MARHLVLLCMCFVLYTVTNVQKTEDTSSTPARPATTPLSLTESNKMFADYPVRRWSKAGAAMQATEFPWLGGLFERARNLRNALRWGHPRTSQSKVYTNPSSITVHPGYNHISHDVAVVELSNSMTFTVSLKPICLWQTTWLPDEGITGTVAGFGPNYKDLKKIELPIVTKETYRTSNAFFCLITSEFIFCAGTRNPEVGLCKGDAGAGYMQWVKDRYYLRGLVSHALIANGTCNLTEYILFADLSKDDIGSFRLYHKDVLEVTCFWDF